MGGVSSILANVRKLCLTSLPDKIQGWTKDRMRMANAASTLISVVRDEAAPVDLMLVVFCKSELMGHEDGSALALGARQSKLGPFGIATSPMLHICGKRTEIATPQQAPFPPLLQRVDCTLHTARCRMV